MANTTSEEGPRDAVDDAREPLDPASIPIALWYGPHAVPDLAQLPRERWAEAIRLTDDRYREKAVDTLRAIGWGAVAEAMGILFELWGEEQDRRERARRAIAFGGKPVPGRGGPPPGPDRAVRRQVNFRAAARQHAELTEAAALAGLKPAELARFLTLRGVQQILAEARPEPAPGGD